VPGSRQDESWLCAALTVPNWSIHLDGIWAEKAVTDRAHHDNDATKITPVYIIQVVTQQEFPLLWPLISGERCGCHFGGLNA
jgi:hypothetical protein